MSLDLKFDRDSKLGKIYSKYINEVIKNDGTELDGAKKAISDAKKAPSPISAVELYTVAAILSARRLIFEVDEVISGADPETEKQYIRDEMEYASECYLTGRSAIKKATTIAAEYLTEAYALSDVASVYYGMAVAWDYIDVGYELFQAAYREHSSIIKRNPSRRR